VKKADFNRKASYGNWIRATNSKHHIYNGEIRKRIEKLEETVLGLERKYEELTIDLIARELLLSRSKSFLDYYEGEIELYKSRKQFRTADKHKFILNKFKLFINSNEFLFSEFDRDMLKRYHSYLSEKLGNSKNTIHTDLKGIKTIFNNAIGDGVISASDTPFINYKIETERTFKQKLDESEIAKLEAMKYEKKSKLWHTTNFFLFAFYCGGMRFSDLACLKWKDINKYDLQYKMAKNKKLVTLKLIEQAQKILNYYRVEGVKDSDFIFPILDSKFEYTDEEFLKKKISSKNAIMNNHLKKIGKDAGISKTISTHIARHSFAFISYHKTKDIDMLRSILNHSSLEDTMNYLTDLGIDAKDNFMDKVFGV
jgi:integrase